MPSQQHTSAIVYLVGAGPGDPGLLTVAGWQVLQRADVVVYDYLANPKLLDLAPAHAERVYVGKSADRHTMTQEQINQLLMEKAGEGLAKGSGRVVVRLKGGDPYVFGRGGEEGEFLRAHGVRFVVIPGITSGIAGPAYAGIPVTHRQFASTMTLITGHEKEEGKGEAEESRVNFEALAKLGGTLVFYMGVKSLPQIVSRLMAAGMSRDMPAAVVRWATRADQRTVTGTLETIAGVVAEAGITAPAITIIGRVVELRETLNWFEERPLFGKRIVVTRTRQQASELSARLAELGAEVLEAPTIELAELENWDAVDGAIGDMRSYDWVVFTSANGVQAAWGRLQKLGIDARGFPLGVAAIGPATAEALRQIGIIANLVPEKFVGEALATALREAIGDIKGKQILLLRADMGRTVLRDELQSAGALVTDLPIYRTVKPASLPEAVVQAIEEGIVDWVTFTSASTVTFLHELLPDSLREKMGVVKKISIGPVTTAALEGIGWGPTLEAERHDIRGMVQALMEHVSALR